MSEGRDSDVFLRLAARARDLPPHARAAFLQAECAGDDELLRAVTEALRAHDAETLAEPLNGAAATPESAHAPPAPRGLRARAMAATPEVEGRAFGQYRLIRTLGEGGMGLVYLAEQPRTKQLVALKLVRPGLASPRLLRRFEQEVRTLGLLRHPNIARIYDAGTEDAGFGPQPYFAMEYVDGRPLTEHVREQSLSLRQMLELLASVCHAVHHAHTKGIIHRDLKPSNVLVDAQGQAKVLDFGVARAVEPDSAATMRTEAGQLVGTLPYMSPEQLGGDPADLDTRSDVYALGVVMYEMLSGSLPHNIATSSLVDAVRIISERDPAPLATGDLRLPTDVRTICFKALERERERRYQSASDMAADIERYLHDQPIAARAPSAVYVMAKFARRNRALVAGGAAVLAVLTAGIVGTSYMAIRATAQRDRAVAAESEAEQARQIAESQRDRAVAAEVEAEHARQIAEEDAATAKSISGFLTSMLSSVDPENALGREITVRDALDTSAASLGATFQEQPMIEAEVRLTLGSAYAALGQLDRARPHYERARELLLERQGPDSRDTLNAQRALGNLAADEGRYEDAETILTQTDAALKQAFGADDQDSLASERDLARVWAETGRMKEAEDAYRNLLDRCRRVLPPDHPQTLVALHNLASCVKDQGRLQEAETLMRESLAERTRVYGEDHPQTLYSINSLAAILSRLGQLEEGETLFRQALQGREKMLGAEHPATALARQNLANHLIIQGRLAEAAPEVERAMAVFTESLGESHPRTIVAVNALGYLQEELENLEAAEALYRRALELTRLSRGSTHPETFAPLNNLASIVQRRGRPAEAAALFKELVDSTAEALPPSHFFLAIFRNNYGDCLREMGDFSQAEPLLIESREALVAALGEQHARIAKATQRLVDLYAAMNDTARADEWRRRLPAVEE